MTALPVAAVPAARRGIARAFLRRPSGTIALAVFLGVVAVAVFAPLIAPHDPNLVNLRAVRAAPGGISSLAATRWGATS